MLILIAMLTNMIVTMDIPQVNPQLLIIVEGLEYAGNLQGARHHPIKLSRFTSKIISTTSNPWANISKVI